MQRIFSVVVAICVVLGFAVADFRDDAVKLHNIYRAKHHSPPLTQSGKLNNVAQNCARKMASTIIKPNRRKGENIWLTSTRIADSEAVKAATNKWYAQVSKYDYSNPGLTQYTKHFTQVVWNSIKQLGIGVARSKGGTFVCAIYDPVGNNDGEFEENVLTP